KELHVRPPRRRRTPGDLLHFRRRREVDALAVAFCNKGHQSSAHPPCLPLLSDVVIGDGGIGHQASERAALTSRRSELHFLYILRLPHLHAEPIAAAPAARPDVRPPPLFGREHSRRG